MMNAPALCTLVYQSTEFPDFTSDPDLAGLPWMIPHGITGTDATASAVGTPPMSRPSKKAPPSRSASSPSARTHRALATAIRAYHATLREFADHGVSHE